MTVGSFSLPGDLGSVQWRVEAIERTPAAVLAEVRLALGTRTTTIQLVVPFRDGQFDEDVFRLRIRRAAVRLLLGLPVVLDAIRTRYADPDGPPASNPVPIHYLRARRVWNGIVWFGVWELRRSLVLPTTIDAPEGWRVRFERGVMVAINPPPELRDHPGFDRATGRLTVEAPSVLELPGRLTGTIAVAATDDFRATFLFPENHVLLESALGPGATRRLARGEEVDAVLVADRVGVSGEVEDQVDVLVADEADEEPEVLRAAAPPPPPTPFKAPRVRRRLARVRRQS